MDEKTEITTGSGNVFRDLGFADPEAELAAADAKLAAQTDVDDGWEWMIVEVMGHRRHAGRVREVERFGAKFMRVDVPNKGDPEAHSWTTRFYPPGSLFGFTPADRDAVMAVNKPYEAPARVALPRYIEEEDDDDRPF